MELARETLNLLPPWQKEVMFLVALVCYLPPVFKKQREVLFWVPSLYPPSRPSLPSPPSPPSPRMFCLISRLLLKLAF